MTWLINIYSIFITVIFCNVLNAQVYTVNTDDDIDNGVCTVLHCSLREAINASEADGVPSTIVFNIPGVGKHFIVPNSPFPSIIENDLTIIGESQSSGVGSIVIDFNYRDFATIPFWKILGKQFTISGIEFTNFLFSNKNKFKNDCIIQFGDPISSSSNCRISNCSFITDKGIGGDSLSTYLINVNNAPDLIISNNSFGTDHTRSFISGLIGYINIGSGQGIGKVSIDSNVFLNKLMAINGLGGDVNISFNIFGALDTSKTPNFLYPEKAIIGRYLDKAVIKHNFFYGHITGTMAFYFMNRDLIISSNIIYSSGASAILLSENYNSSNYIVDNYAVGDPIFLKGAHRPPFITESDNFELYIERNDVSYYEKFIENWNSQLYRIERHIDNKMRCMGNVNDYVIVMPGHAKPVIRSVNRNQISGSGNPNDSVVVYANNTIFCPDASCAGGVELGRTRADSSGNWILNAIYPGTSYISAFQYDSDPIARPTIYSEFSKCYKCPGSVHINLGQSICPGEIINYRGHNFSDLNPIDSFLIKGDVSICDSIFHVNLFVYPVSRSQIDTQTCYNDTLKFGSVLIHQGHQIDSFKLQTITGCDSTIIINAVLTGSGQFKHNICENDTLRIGNTIFNKDHLSGQAFINGGSSIGCDSIVDVNLSINNSFSVDLPNDTTVHKGNPITIKPFVNFIPSSIKWSPNLYLDCDTCLYPISKPENNITYQLTAKDTNGCDVSDLITISILVDNAEIFIPNAFSPNGDNINDIFQPVFKFPNSTAIKEFRIYDRWGDQVYQRFDGAIGEIFGWDGTANGEKMNPGVYIYWIQFVGEDNVVKVKAGDVTLVR